MSLVGKKIKKSFKGAGVKYLSLDSAHHFDVVALRVDSGLFH